MPHTTRNPVFLISPNPASPNAAAPVSGVSPSTVAGYYAALVHANYKGTVAAAKDMQTAIAAFVQAPSSKGIQKVRNTWLTAREFYDQTEAFCFYGDPIDDNYCSGLLKSEVIELSSRVGVDTEINDDSTGSHL